MSGVLFLSSVMMRGYGVSLVAEEVCRRWSLAGVAVHIGCIHTDVDGGFVPDLTIPLAKLGPDPVEIETYCSRHDLSVVMAQTSPYFEVLPHLSSGLHRVVFEHGDPTPDLFTHDALERSRIVAGKQSSVYPFVDVVACSSHFLAEDIAWRDAVVVHLGCDHVPDLGPKQVMLDSDELVVGCLMRLGPGEALYKGNDLLVDLIQRIADEPGVRFRLMGRGTDADVEWWSNYGVDVTVNAPESEKIAFLRSVDILVSPSLWEGFNLPVVEAQALATPALAFDTGAHPETCALVMRSVSDMENVIRSCHASRDRLQVLSDRAYRYSRESFAWDRTSAGLLRIIEPAL